MKSIVPTILFVLLVISTHETQGSMCKRSLTKRLLKMIGVNPNTTPCFINTRREMARFIDNAVDEIRERAFMEDEGVELAREWPLVKRGRYDGQYCCSPTCDRYMSHMNVKPKYVTC